MADIISNGAGDLPAGIATTKTLLRDGAGRISGVSYA